MMTLDDFLRSKGFEEAIGLPLDGQFHRYARGGSQSSGWFKGRFLETAKIAVARFGDWRTGESHEFYDRPEDRYGVADAQEELMKIAAEEKNARATRQHEVQAEVRNIYGVTSGTQHSPYFERKGLRTPAAEYGCKVESDSPAAKKYGPQTLVPAYDIEGNLWGLQRIGENGFKSFKEGMRIKGCFCGLWAGGWAAANKGEPPQVVILCEGIATAGSIFDAFSQEISVLSCFNAGNLKHVAREVRAKWPDCRIVIAGDNDQWVVKPDGTPWNPGYDFAEKAMLEAGSNSAVVMPPFPHDGDKLTDWNDWHVIHGLESVRQHIEPCLHLQKTGAGDSSQEIAKGEGTAAKKKDDGPHLEKKLADALLRSLGDRIVREEGSLFAYDDRRWVELDETAIDRLKNQINAMANNKLPSKTVNSSYATFLRYVPGVPQGMSLFDPNPAAANFLDGTLHLTRDLGTGAYQTEFRKHAASDYLTSVIPMSYKAGRTGAKNALWEKLLDEAFEGDADKDAKIKSLQECGGAMLVSAFPQMFILHGKSGSRKSTLAKVLLKPLQKEGFSNVSWVDPCDMENFMVEGMIGKLVNANTDIDDFKALPRGFIKRFEDNLPSQVNRKGKKVVSARLPALHLYCANELPPNYEKSKAFGRRVTLIGCDQDGGRKDQKFYEDLIFQAGPDAILAFMLEGLDRLVANGGNFTVPVSSKKAVEDWTRGYDAVGSFIAACKEGELILEDKSRMMVGSGLKIEQPRLWGTFKIWREEEFKNGHFIGRNRFYDAMVKAGFQKYRDKSGDYFMGLGTEK